MKFKIGDRVRIINNNIFENCEGVIIDISNNDCYWIDLYKNNDSLSIEEIKEYSIRLNINELELLYKLDIKRLREEKETKIISTEESLIDIIPFYDPEDFK